MKDGKDKFQIILIKDELANYLRLSISKKVLLTFVSILSISFVFFAFYSVYAFLKLKKYNSEKKVLLSNIESLERNLNEVKRENSQLHEKVSILEKERRETVQELARRIEIINSLMKKVGLNVKEKGGEGGLSIPLSKIFTEDDVDFDSRDVIKQIDSLIKRFNHVPIGYPTYGRITSPYGLRVNPVTGKLEFHLGVDIANYWGTPIRTPADGRVIKAGKCGLMGRCIEIDHGNGVRTYFGHMSKLLVRKGQFVKKGEIIGLMGSTGRSTGPHLHYTIKVNGKIVNPKLFLEAVRNVRKKEGR
ncbi:Peptidase family M23 [Balnearium lithotrophicum]|uniref:Peptidase family M23 n=1 Tax=Balnearium lithotrophicum TaxID=223788 RepID=A0A521DF33_9BACT|nr:M23 family metallopeptidase [Balnearium lithotrophicum]SMO70309.1 Peptidase family M23 [Balnearium lithotrophicum]